MRVRKQNYPTADSIGSKTILLRIKTWIKTGHSGTKYDQIERKQ